jgi:hypothetical protein
MSVSEGWVVDEKMMSEMNEMLFPPLLDFCVIFFTVTESQISILESPSEQRYPFLSLVATTTSLRNDYQCE